MGLRVRIRPRVRVRVRIVLLHGVDGEAALPRGRGQVEVGSELAHLGGAE